MCENFTLVTFQYKPFVSFKKEFSLKERLLFLMIQIILVYTGIRMPVSGKGFYGLILFLEWPWLEKTPL
jgi:hypothetical protein